MHQDKKLHALTHMHQDKKLYAVNHMRQDKNSMHKVNSMQYVWS